MLRRRLIALIARVTVEMIATAQPRKFKESSGELQVPGGHQLAHELAEGDLVDQVNLLGFPVILGTGKRVIEEKSEQQRSLGSRNRRSSATAWSC